MVGVYRIFKSILFQIVFSILLTLFLGIVIYRITNPDFNVLTIVGFSLILFGLFWFFLFITKYMIFKRKIVWMLFPFLILSSTGIPFFIGQTHLLDFFFFCGMGLGVSLIIAGITWKLFGLIIPGALLIGTMPGLFFAWEKTNAVNPLEQTGIMLVGHAFGWGLITVTSRAITKNFIWWPLIPGGIMAVVGWGLFIAGNPESAIGFIGNTGSIGLIIFGIYILLMRRSFHN